MNHLHSYQRLQNRFFVMRHGESEANRQGLIISAPAAGISGYGLTGNGRAQVLRSIAADSRLNAETLIYTSDFKRALETAQIVHRRLACNALIETRPALRERYFGDFEGDDHSNYEKVWEADKKDAGHTRYHVEAATAVMDRVTAVVCQLEQALRGQMILLVAHGDVLQILQTAFQKRPAEQHRSLPHLNTAEIRELTLLATR